MKPESRLRRTTTSRILIAAVLLFCFSSLSGCITNKVLNLRREREMRVKEAVNFWSLAAVRSAHVIAGSDAFACVEFRDSPADAPQSYTVNLSQAARIGRPFPEFMPAGHDRADVTWHFYPLQEARKGCESPSPVSELKIETVQIQREDQSRLPGRLLSPDGQADSEGRLIEVSFAPADNEVEPSAAKDVLLVYLPPAKTADQVQPIGVAGAFETISEWVNPYSLLIAPAVAADAGVIYMIIMLGGDPFKYR